jgi:hypothetical protein
VLIPIDVIHSPPPQISTIVVHPLGGANHGILETYPGLLW